MKTDRTVGSFADRCAVLGRNPPDHGDRAWPYVARGERDGGTSRLDASRASKREEACHRDERRGRCTRFALRDGAPAAAAGRVVPSAAVDGGAADPGIAAAGIG